MNWAYQSIKKGDIEGLRKALLITFVLGLGFGICQFISWSLLVKEKIFFTGVESNASSSYLYVITLVHLCHIIGGLVALAIVYFGAMRNKYSAKSYNGIKLCAIYWHFLDVLWIYLFVFLLIMR